MMKEALVAGTAESSFGLLEQFRTQDEPSYCGLGTLVMALNALDIDPGRVWKGVWRWFSEDMLDCCEPLEVIQQQGLIFDNFCCLARCNGALVEAHRPDEEGETLERFRRRLEATVSKPEGEVLVVSYSRKAFDQTGDGHYSPIGAYHKEEDAALILDVARFKLPPHWVPLPLLWEALQYEDDATGRCRGYALLSRRPDFAYARHWCSPGFLLSLSLPAWNDLTRALDRAKATLRQGVAPTDALSILSEELRPFGGLVREDIHEGADGEGGCSEHAAEARELRSEVLKYLNGSCQLTFQEAWATGRADAQAFGADVLALPPELWLPSSLRSSSEMKFLDPREMSPRLAAEVHRLREQLLNVHAMSVGQPKL